MAKKLCDLVSEMLEEVEAMNDRQIILAVYNYMFGEDI